VKVLRRLLPPFLAVALLPGACRGDDGGQAAGDRGSITVFAAASLTDAFEELGAAFADEEGGRVTFQFGPSSGLVRQLTQGAPADVFASADTASMDALVAARGNAGTPTVFATNRLAIIVEAGNPKGIDELADLAASGVLYVAANPEVPIGRYAAEALRKAGVEVTPRSLEVDVKSLVTKVTLGEADAAIVYATDVAAAGDDAEGVDVPDVHDVRATYPVVAMKASANLDLAEDFVAFLTGKVGRQILADHGFGPP
jgi:molybdate transport system substrate-binding protein